MLGPKQGLAKKNRSLETKEEKEQWKEDGGGVSEEDSWESITSDSSLK